MKIQFLKEWVRTFFFIFGILQLLLAVSAYLWDGATYIPARAMYLYEVARMLFVSAILTTCYFVITSDPVASRRSLILRLVGCSIPFALVSWILSSTFGFHDKLLGILVDTFYEPLIPTKTRIMIEHISSFVSIIIYFGILLLIALRQHKQSKLYNAALDAYKNADE